MSAERRRLRFSFQINDVKDPTGVSGPTVLRPVAAKSGVSICREVPCQSAFSNLFLAEAGANFRAQKSFRAARDNPQKSEAIRLEERRLETEVENCKREGSLLRRAVQLSSERGGLLSAVFQVRKPVVTNLR